MRADGRVGGEAEGVGILEEGKDEIDKDDQPNQPLDQE